MKTIRIVVIGALCMSSCVPVVGADAPFYKRPLPLIALASGVAVTGAIAYKLYSYISALPQHTQKGKPTQQGQSLLQPNPDVSKTMDALKKLEEAAVVLYNTKGNQNGFRALYQGLEHSLISVEPEDIIVLRGYVMDSNVQVNSLLAAIKQLKNGLSVIQATSNSNVPKSNATSDEQPSLTISQRIKAGLKKDWARIKSIFSTKK